MVGPDGFEYKSTKSPFSWLSRWLFMHLVAAHVDPDWFDFELEGYRVKRLNAQEK